VFKVKGSIVALVTPMEKDGGISWQSLFDLIDWHIDSGISAIVVVGTTGESATLDISEHVQIIEQSVQHSAGRVPIIAGTGANSTKEAIYLTVAAKEAGASAALLVTPYYNRPTQKGLIKHYSEIASEVDIPQILYNVPTRTACDLLPETVAILSSLENIIGLKEASPDTQRLSQLQKILGTKSKDESFFLYSGDDLTACNFLIEGGHGIISVTANVVPKKISELCDLALGRNFKEAKGIDAKLRKLHQALFVETSPIPVKWVLNKMGRIPPGIRLPLTNLDEDYIPEIELILNKLSLIN
jgi:4-hydroxy-tetrahydrodipicolinate synthase